MNTTAEKHCAKAKNLIAKGDQFYRQAKPEIEAALLSGASLREVSRYLDRSTKWVADVRDWDGQGTLYGKDTGERQTRQTRQVLRESTPEQVEQIVASLPPETVAKVAKAVSREYEKRGEQAKKVSEAAFRDEVGDAFADDLAEEQRLRDAEAKVFEARRALRDMLALLNDADLDAMRDSWREDFLKTLDDLSTRVDMARSLLSGTLEEDLARFLSEV